jgi:hypothetical protein
MGEGTVGGRDLCDDEHADGIALPSGHSSGSDQVERPLQDGAGLCPCALPEAGWLADLPLSPAACH